MQNPFIQFNTERKIKHFLFQVCKPSRIIYRNPILENTLITVIIATSFSRKHLLISRALRSIYQQILDNPHDIQVLVVNDSVEGDAELETRIHDLRKEFRVPDTYFTTIALSNNRTRGHSGTGAWNTGIVYNRDKLFNPYVAFLDDDDEWRVDYLQEHISAIEKTQPAGVFSWLKWIDHSATIDSVDKLNKSLQFSKKDLIPENFFIGNPGIQGSNMFFKAEILYDIDGFDEHFSSATDREIMIRFLKLVHKKSLDIKVISKVLTTYHYHNSNVTGNRQKKLSALDLFYKKFKSDFSEDAFQQSIKRAERLFGYKMKGKI